MLQMMLHGLNYLHQVCHVIHTGRNVKSTNGVWKLDQLIHMTDLKPSNIMVRLEDRSILERSAHDEFDNPLPQKKCADWTVYLARNN